MPTEGKKRNKTERRVLGSVAHAHFVGREEELRRIVNLAQSTAGGRNLLLLAAPFAGARYELRSERDL